MGKCNLDHSLEDVKNKFNSQKPYLQQRLVEEWITFLNRDLSQVILNEAFHLLKKYDLATSIEKEKRDKQMKDMFRKVI
ncbi:hypothetical protein ACM26V_06390 [Salipaludibacillus sp. HK11]|uniref:hypothetical protein n=1 Tax=Salipaludibacillus sp. HK11 TaxID=3394320 RepID=UPI0039FCCACE